MERLIYIFDTNAISDLIERKSPVVERVRTNQRHVMCLCKPVHYEVRRGLLHSVSTRKTQMYETQVRPLFQWLSMEDADWEQAARFWAEARRTGKQFSDVDLFIAALAARLDAIIISADDDYDALPVRRENWRK